MFSRRTDLPLEANALTQRLAERRATGAQVLDLTESNPTRAGIPYHPDVVHALAREQCLVYAPEPFGLAAARAAVAAELSWPASQLLLTASTSEAYAYLFKLLCDPGDHVLVPAPSYPLLEHLARLESVVMDCYPLAYDGAWHIDLDAVRRATTKSTRAIVLVSPNNPTGNYLHQSELAALTELGLPLIADEVFASYPLLDVPTKASVLAAEGAVSFSLGGLSKLAALPQMKLGWIACNAPPEMLSPLLARLEIVADAFLSVATPVQLAVGDLLATRSVAHDAILKRTRANLTTLRDVLADTAATVLHVEGGWYATVRLPESQDDEAWALRFLEEDGVLVQPGYFFDFESGAYAVISLLTPEATLRDGAQRIAQRVG